MIQDKRFVSGRIKSVGFAAKGAYKLVTTEHSVMVQFSIMIIMIVAGFYFNISREEWMIQVLAFGLVIAVEGLNTAVEKIADFVHPEFHDKIGFIKDIAAGAVLFAAFSAIAVGTLIYAPKIFNF
ncbi:diacylglycerol kinase family protein [Flavobacterium difficile]|uniref:Diacylglycerol kinase family protein n=1 Tax=Flavobacterium difficile TaxID=2709659 RepID=A0ABX0I471_9FLAO|nr:diacylglycerol kinase family protein [Flavobacterium difficile]NHM01526.1 diacylglycerol kinase family protein [Flavobacterium difficile]